jgi:hypothetical protein
MGRDGVPRLRLVVVVEGGGAGPRLCCGCGGPLMPSAKSTAVFCSSSCRSGHWRRLRRTRARTEAVQADRTANCPECGASWTVGVGTSSLGTVLLSPLPQTVLAQTAHEAGQGASAPGGGEAASRAGAVRPAGGRRPPDGWDDSDDRERDPGTLRRTGQAGVGLGGHDERGPVADFVDRATQTFWWVVSWRAPMRS